ncbi:Uncharacterised protein [Vibrio cholerae]|nr:Uncharacterised protein [Vibrio cholerae]
MPARLTKPRSAREQIKALRSAVWQIQIKAERGTVRTGDHFIQHFEVRKTG